MAPVDARQAQDEHPVPRDPARDPAARRPIGALYIDEWAMLVAAAITVVVGGRLPDPRDSPLLHRGDAHDARLRHGRQRPGRRRARAAARSSAATTVVGARPLRRGRGQARGGRRAHRARRHARRGGADRGHARLRAASTTSPASTRSARRPRGALPRQRPRRRDRRARRARRPACAGSCSPRPPPARRGGGHRRHARTARIAAATCRSTSAPSTRASRGVRGGAERRDRARRASTAVVRPGSGPRRRHGPDPDRLPQRQAEGVRRHAHQPRRHRRHGRGATCSPPSAARRASAT